MTPSPAPYEGERAYRRRPRPRPARPGGTAAVARCRSAAAPCRTSRRRTGPAARSARAPRPRTFAAYALPSKPNWLARVTEASTPTKSIDRLSSTVEGSPTDSKPSALAVRPGPRHVDHGRHEDPDHHDGDQVRPASGVPQPVAALADTRAEPVPADPPTPGERTARPHRRRRPPALRWGRVAAPTIADSNDRGHHHSSATMVDAVISSLAGTAQSRRSARRTPRSRAPRTGSNRRPGLADQRRQSAGRHGGHHQELHRAEQRPPAPSAARPGRVPGASAAWGRTRWSPRGSRPRRAQADNRAEQRRRRPATRHHRAAPDHQPSAATSRRHRRDADQRRREQAPDQGTPGDRQQRERAGSRVSSTPKKRAAATPSRAPAATGERGHQARTGSSAKPVTANSRKPKSADKRPNSATEHEQPRPAAWPPKRVAHEAKFQPDEVARRRSGRTSSTGAVTGTATTTPRRSTSGRRPPRRRRPPGRAPRVPPRGCRPP